MSCNNSCRLCDQLIISQAVTFAADTLTINLPAGSYSNCCRYCIVVAQAIPAETTINAAVVVTIGDGTVEYPVVNRCCAPVTACSIRTRTKYPVIVSTTAAGGTFKVLGGLSCAPNNALAAIDGTDPAAAGGGAG